MTAPATLADVVARTARSAPSREAVVDADVRLSYSQLLDAATQHARALSAAGLAPGARVAHLGAPGAVFVVATLGTSLAGGVWSGLDPRWTAAEMARALDGLDPSLLLVDATLPQPVHSALRQALERTDRRAVVRHVASVLDLSSPLPRLPPPRTAPPAGTAVIVHTSGTTGVPKGACLTHAGLVEAGRLYADRYGHPDARTVLNLPINHVGALVDLVASTLTMGGSVVCVPRFEPAELPALMSAERITLLGQVPTMHLAIDEVTGYDPNDLPHLRHLVWSGAAMPRAWIADRSGGRVELSTCYGQTECSGAVTFTRPGASVDELARTVGLPAHPGLVRLRDGSDVSATPGAVGELEISGPLLAAGYFRDAQATRDMTTHDGWLRTGDLARVCADGAVELVGRLREMFKSGGYNVYPREVELALESHASVVTAAVLAVPDERFQEVGHAFVVTRRPTSAGELEAHARLLLAGYKVPRAVHLRTELPLLSNGKVDKSLLRRHATPRSSEESS